LEQNNRGLAVDGWMRDFANMVLEAQDTIKRVGFYVAKAKFYEKFPRQIQRPSGQGNRLYVPGGHRWIQGRS